MNAQIERLIDELLADEGLPTSTLKRAATFIRDGDLNQLTELPLTPEEMMQAGTVLLRAPANGHYTAVRTPRPVLSPPLRRRLRALVDEEGPHADAALFILTQDLKARALNGALAPSS